MDKAERENRLAFLSLTEEDLGALRGLRSVFEERSDEFVTVFYRHLLAFDETRALLMDPDVKARLLEKQWAYLISLTDGSIDDAYVADRLRIGKTHMRVGLEPRWYLGAYSLYMQLLLPIVSEHYRAEPQTAERALLALYKLLTFDAQLAMEAYIAGREQQLEFLNRELGEASRALQSVYRKQTAELRQTSARAQAAEQLASVATLVAGLAHEIGTPMSVIQGHAELLESSVHDERGRWRLTTIREQIDRIANIMQTLLNIARPHPPESARLDLVALIDASLAFLQEKFRARGIHAEFHAPESIAVLGDREKLQQLFLNLFLNAADAMPEGGLLEVTAREAEDLGVEITVRDTGHGMPAPVVERIFEPFFTTKEAGRGSGLGLMIAAGIVRDHQGQIDVKSDEGSGTTFRIALPAFSDSQNVT